MNSQSSALHLQENGEAVQTFTTTRWSRVLRAGSPGSPDHHKALDELCRQYWRPLYHFARGTGHSHDDASELVQDFFAAAILERNAAGAAISEKGRFRTFLLACFKHHKAQVWRKRQAAKRGGGTVFISSDQLDEEGRGILPEPKDMATPEEIFDRRWASAVLNKALEKARAGKEERFDALEPHLFYDPDADTLETIAKRLGRAVGTIKSELFRLRQAVARAIRDEIAQTVSDDAGFLAELEYFKRLFTR